MTLTVVQGVSSLVWLNWHHQRIFSKWASVTFSPGDHTSQGQTLLKVVSVLSFSFILNAWFWEGQASSELTRKRQRHHWHFKTSERLSRLPHQTNKPVLERRDCEVVNRGTRQTVTTAAFHTSVNLSFGLLFSNTVTPKKLGWTFNNCINYKELQLVIFIK